LVYRPEDREVAGLPLTDYFGDGSIWGGSNHVVIAQQPEDG